jgi:hypothetical protein
MVAAVNSKGNVTYEFLGFLNKDSWKQANPQPCGGGHGWVRRVAGA